AARKVMRRPDDDFVNDNFRSGAESAAANVSLSPAPITADTTAPIATASRRLVIPWTGILLGIYLAGVAILFTRLLVGVWLSHRLERAAQNIISEDIHGREALRLLRFRSCIAGLASAPRLKESAMLAVPATVGVRRAVILLPADWRAWDEEQLDAILAHEVSHVARRDALTQLLSLVHRAIFWFSPLGWWLDKQLTDLAEQASDEAALAGGADRTRYAETLLGFFAQLGAAPGRVWWQGVSMAKAAKAGSAERRVDRILAWKGAISVKKSFAVALIAIAAPVIFLAASVHPFIASAQDKPPAPPQNIVQPGGPAAPALPAAPKAPGVVAPALAPTAGPVAPAPMGTQPAPALAPAIAGPVTPAALAMPTARPALMPVPGAPLHPPLVPGPVAEGPVAPAALSGTRMLRPLPAGAIEPPAPIAPIVPAVPNASSAPVTPQATVSASEAMQEAQSQLAAARKALAKADAQFGRGSAQVRADQEALAEAEQQLEKIEPKTREAFAQAKEALADAEQEQRGVTIVNGSFSVGGGPRYVIMSGKPEDVNMSGSDEDLEHARHLQNKIGSDFIWFERDEKSYIITDPAFIAKAKALFAPENALSKQQDELSRQQDALSKQQDALGEQMDSVKVKVPDITPDLERIRAELNSLRQQNGGTQRELGRLQSELGQLQSQVGRFQSEAGVQQSAIGRQQGELGRQQGELGRRQGELGRQQGEIARKASQQLREMFDDAISKGIAKPE
ncbi:MAG: M56 family metallopeptidase, partial [Candidatus Acidiferrales bacterium]